MKKTISVMLLATATAFSSWPVLIDVDEDSLLEPMDILILDSGEVILSMAGPFTSPEIICIDPAGAVLWHKTVLEKDDMSRAFESGGFLAATPEGFAAAFHSQPRATGVDTDVAVVAFDVRGEILWTYTLGLEDRENWMCSHMISSSDGGLLIIGSPAGTMLPAGYAMKLSAEGSLQWITPTDVMENHPVSAAEMQNGDFLCLTESHAGETPILQPISASGRILPGIQLSTDGIIPAGIHNLQGSLWLTSSGSGGVVDAVRLDGTMDVNGAMSAVFSGVTGIRHISAFKDGFLLAGEHGDSAYMALLDTDGVVLEESFTELEESCIFTCATGNDTMIAACGFVFGQEGIPVSIVVHRRE